jgi:hypothetical protein
MRSQNSRKSKSNSSMLQSNSRSSPKGNHEKVSRNLERYDLVSDGMNDGCNPSVLGSIPSEVLRKMSGWLEDTVFLTPRCTCLALKAAPYGLGRFGRGRLKTAGCKRLGGSIPSFSATCSRKLELYESESRLAKGICFQIISLGVQIPPGSPKPNSRGQTRALWNRGRVVYCAVLLRRAD